MHGVRDHERHEESILVIADGLAVFAAVVVLGGAGLALVDWRVGVSSHAAEVVVWLVVGVAAVMGGLRSWSQSRRQHSPSNS